MIHARISANAEKHMALKRQRLSISQGALGFHIAEDLVTTEMFETAINLRSERECLARHDE